MMRGAVVLMGFVTLAACETEPPTPEQAAQRCEKRAQDAQAPNVSGTIGASTDGGPFAGISIGVSADLLRGRDPLDVYESCVIDLTGELPIRPPRLRKI